MKGSVKLSLLWLNSFISYCYCMSIIHSQCSVIALLQFIENYSLALIAFNMELLQDNWTEQWLVTYLYLIQTVLSIQLSWAFDSVRGFAYSINVCYACNAPAVFIHYGFRFACSSSIQKTLLTLSCSSFSWTVYVQPVVPMALYVLWPIICCFWSVFKSLLQINLDLRTTRATCRLLISPFSNIFFPLSGSSLLNKSTTPVF